MLKKTMSFLVIICLTGASLMAQTTVQSAGGQEVKITDTSRIITIGGSITATTFALGAGENVVAVDVSSTYPSKVKELPKVPYLRQLTAEGILSLDPSLILASEHASPKTAIQQLRAAGVPVVLIPVKASIEGVKTKFRRIAKALGKQEKAEQLINDLNKKIERAQTLKKKVEDKPKVMFVLSIGQGSPTVAGKHSSASKIIQLAGGKNVFQSFSGYKAVSMESIAANNPDVILMMGNRMGKGAVENVKQMPGISLTNAAQNDRVYAFDGNFLIGFGPRTGDAVLKLVHLFHPKLPENFDK